MHLLSTILSLLNTLTFHGTHMWGVRCVMTSPELWQCRAHDTSGKSFVFGQGPTAHTALLDAVNTVLWMADEGAPLEIDATVQKELRQLLDAAPKEGEPPHATAVAG